MCHEVTENIYDWFLIRSKIGRLGYSTEYIAVPITRIALGSIQSVQRGEQVISFI